MVSSSKILTVSYGTFSCTLEGFDDSFDTMKAIAEYFRDLAQDDRYFGAEPPTPDAEMLARIAEREIERRVEARMENGSYVLRPSLSAPVAAAPETAAQKPKAKATDKATDADTLEPVAAASDIPVAESPVEAPVAESPEVAEAAEADAMSVALAAQRAMATTDTATDEAQATAQADVAETATTQDNSISGSDEDEDEVEDDDVATVIDPAQMAPAPATPDVNSVAAKLQRIRAVVSASGAPSPTYSEDQHADAFLASGDEEPAFDAGAMQSVMEEINEPAAETPAKPAATADAEPDFDDEDDADTLGENLFTDTIAGFVAAQDSIDKAPVAADKAKTVPPAAAAPSPATRARVVKVKRADFEAAVAAGHLEEVDEDDGASSLSAEEEADLAAELAAVEAELDTSWDEDEDEDDIGDDDDAVAESDDDFEGYLDEEDEDEEVFAEAAPTRDTGLRLRKEPVAAAPADTAEDEDDASILAAAARRSSLWGDDLDDDIETAFDDDDDDDDDANRPALHERDEVDEAIANMAVEGARKAVKMSSPARVLLTENKIEEDGSSVSRILDETNTQLEEPEGNRRRSAIAHLRAAVAATRADRVLGRKKDTEEEAKPYRADLANAVRPRRPVASADTRSERPSEVKPAPLKLVAEQRVDAEQAAAAPIRPRRVTRNAEAEMAALPEDESEGGFAEFAENMGATELPELLEAAAAYMSFVEGRDQFSRPQLMTKVRQAELEESSREDRLRSFGQLLREGKIEKTHGGRFTASERISFKPGKRAAG